MKILAVSFTFIILISCNADYKKNEQNGTLGHEFLTQFYTNYLALQSEELNSSNYAFHDQRVDSILKANCTKELFILAKNFWEAGRDYMTMDLVSVDSNEDLKIQVLNEDKGWYKVSFKAKYFEAPNGQQIVEVIFCVRIVKIGEQFKIEQVSSNCS